MSKVLNFTIIFGVLFVLSISGCPGPTPNGDVNNGKINVSNGKTEEPDNNLKTPEVDEDQIRFNFESEIKNKYFSSARNYQKMQLQAFIRLNSLKVARMKYRKCWVVFLPVFLLKMKI